MPEAIRLRPNTFFLLLLSVGKPELGESTGWGESTGLTEAKLIERLVQIGNPDFKAQNYDTLKSYMSSFKSGSSNTANSKTYFPFGRQNYVATFKERMRTGYEDVLNDMFELTEFFLDLDNGSNKEILVAALLDAISSDETIDDTLLFDIGEKEVTRSQLKDAFKIYLIPFLLTTWFNISVHKGNSCEAKGCRTCHLGDNFIGKITVKLEFEHKKTAPSSPFEEENDAVNEKDNTNVNPDVEVLDIPSNKNTPSITMINNDGVMIGVNSGTINLNLGGPKNDK